MEFQRHAAFVFLVTFGGPAAGPFALGTQFGLAKWGTLFKETSKAAATSFAATAAQQSCLNYRHALLDSSAKQGNANFPS